jgi:hypothetical protein
MGVLTSSHEDRDTNGGYPAMNWMYDLDTGKSDQKSGIQQLQPLESIVVLPIGSSGTF